MTKPVTPLLDMLERNQVFSITHNKHDDSFHIWEECDRYFTVVLTRDELRWLAAEILSLADTHP